MEDITREYLQLLEEEISGRKDDLLRARFDALHPADIAELLDHLNDEQVQYLWKLIHKDELTT